MYNVIGPYESVADSLREQYDELYCTVVNGIFFIWRPLTIKEYKKLQRKYHETAVCAVPSQDDIAVEEAVCRLCVLEPTGFNYETCLAGIPTSITKSILQSSGFGEFEEETLNKYRGIISGMPEKQMYMVIKEIFGNDYSIEDIECMSRGRMLEKFAYAEWAMANLRGMPIEFQEPEPDNTSPMDAIERITGEKSVHDAKEKLKERTAKQQVQMDKVRDLQARMHKMAMRRGT